MRFAKDGSDREKNVAALLITLAIKHAENQVPEGLHQYNTPQETAAFQSDDNNILI